MEKTIKTMENTIAFKNVQLDGATLTVEKHSTTYEIEWEVSEKTKRQILSSKTQVGVTKVEKLTFDLVEVTPLELRKFWRNKTPSFVLKEDGRYYHTQIPKDISFISAGICGAHLCARVGAECTRLSAAPDELGGCEKVRNRSCHIERYPWITYGFETFSTRDDVFCVAKCQHYKEREKKWNKVDLNDLYSKRLSLAQYLWDDVKSLSQVAERTKANLKRNATK